MLKLLAGISLAFCFTANAHPGHAGHPGNPNWRNEVRRPVRRPAPPVVVIPDRNYVEKIGEAYLPYNNDWTYIYTNSCGRPHYMSGDQIKLQMDNYAAADVVTVEVVFGDGRRGRQDIEIGNWTFREGYTSTGWFDLAGRWGRDRCIKEVWIWGKTVRLPHKGYVDEARISIWLRDL